MDNNDSPVGTSDDASQQPPPDRLAGAPEDHRQPPEPGSTPDRGMLIPDSLAGEAFARWDESSYGPGILGSGARKLAESVVAPLVALARGYRSLRPDNVREVMSGAAIHPNSAGGRQLLRAVGDLDALLMPWFKGEDVATYWNQRADDRFPVPASSLQYRPHPVNVATDPKTGKKRKYENLSGQTAVLGVHPATPPSWVGQPVATVLITEGLLKGDSALTALLREHGASATDLAYRPGDEDPRVARHRLRLLLDGVPGDSERDKRVLVVTVVGVGTWKQNPEWNTLRLKDADVWVAFDGDLATNPRVWSQAKDLFTHIRGKGASPKLLDLSQEPSPTGGKVGVDDYLAAGGDWAGLVDRLSTTLPPRPQGDTDARYRMDQATRTMQEQVDLGEDLPRRWVSRAPMIARVRSTDERRAVRPHEEETGVFDASAGEHDDLAACTVEFEWFEPDGNEPRTTLVHGSADLLAAKPDRWRDKAIDARVPLDLSLHPAWPPRVDGFVEAMKTHRRDEIVRRASWSHMGWVPVPDATAVFVVGEQVIGPNGEDPTLASSAVDDTALRNASSFGVCLPYDEAEARAAVRAMLDAYRACWSDRRHCSVIIAAGLRPAVPLRTHTVVLFSGHTGTGKSFSEAAIMGFWQAAPGRWSERRLPGTASDTPAAVEVAVSQTPIWVMDDLAPSGADPQTQARAQSRMNEIIRNVHNGGSRARRTKDMKAQEQFTPRALLVASAEAAPLTETSIMNRLIHVEAQPGFLVPDREPTNRLLHMMAGSNDAAKVTGFALTMLARDIQVRGWGAVREELKGKRDVHELILNRRLRRDNPHTLGDTGRRSAVVADLSLGIHLLDEVMSRLGLHEQFPGLVESMLDDVYAVANEGFNETSEIDMGVQVVDRLRSLLASGQCHIDAAGAAGPPVVVGPDGDPSRADACNQQLGWTLTGLKERPCEPRGVTVGVLLHDLRNLGEPVVIVDASTAFNLMQRAYGRDGHSAKSVWDAAWRSGQCYEGSWTRKARPGSRAKYHWVRAMVHGTQHTGVPIHLGKLLNMDEAAVAALDLTTHTASPVAPAEPPSTPSS